MYKGRVHKIFSGMTDERSNHCEYTPQLTDLILIQFRLLADQLCKPEIIRISLNL